MDSPYFQVAKKIVRDQQAVQGITRLAELVVAGKCICRERDRFAFKCPIHDPLAVRV